MSFNTVPPNDFTYWEMVNGLVRQEPAGAGDPEILGQLAAVGIVKGQPFKPDAQMREVLEDAVVVGNATARTISFAPRPEEGFAYYPGSAWLDPRLSAATTASTGRRRSPRRAPSRARATARAI